MARKRAPTAVTELCWRRGKSKHRNWSDGRIEARREPIFDIRRRVSVVHYSALSHVEPKFALGVVCEIGRVGNHTRRIDDDEIPERQHDEQGKAFHFDFSFLRGIFQYALLHLGQIIGLRVPRGVQI